MKILQIDVIVEKRKKSVVTITFAIICGPQGGALFTVITWGIQQGKGQEIK